MVFYVGGILLTVKASVVKNTPYRVSVCQFFPLICIRIHIRPDTLEYAIFTLILEKNRKINSKNYNPISGIGWSVSGQKIRIRIRTGHNTGYSDIDEFSILPILPINGHPTAGPSPKFNLPASRYLFPLNALKVKISLVVSAHESYAH